MAERLRLLACFAGGLLLAGVVASAGHTRPAAARGVPVVRVGVLEFGTVRWELDTILHNGLDRNQGVALKVTPLAGKNGSAVALQGGAVDVIVTDYIWVSRQRGAGRDYVFAPHSLAVGGVMVRPDAGIARVADLFGTAIGVAGGPVDKSWLLLRAYAEQEYGRDLAASAAPRFAAPPLINALMLRGDLPAALNFWHYNSRLSAAGMTQLVSVADILRRLGIAGQAPLLGWVFSEEWARRNPGTARGFLAASAAAKRLLATSDAAWRRLRPMMKAEDDATFRALRASYRAGIPNGDMRTREAESVAARVFRILAKHGGRALVGEADQLAPGTFWNGGHD